MFHTKTKLSLRLSAMSHTLWELSLYLCQHFAKPPKTFAFPSHFTDCSPTPVVDIPDAVKATVPAPLCFDQVEANHWPVEQEAGSIAWYGSHWQPLTGSQTVGTSAVLADSSDLNQVAELEWASVLLFETKSYKLVEMYRWYISDWTEHKGKKEHGRVEGPMTVGFTIELREQTFNWH